MPSPTAIHREVSRNVRAIIAVWDLNQADVARWLGISQGAISSVMSGHRPWSLNYIHVIAGQCGVTVSELTGPLPELMRCLPEGGPFPQRVGSEQPDDDGGYPRKPAGCAELAHAA